MCHESANVVGSVSPALRTEASWLTRLTFHVQAQRRDDIPLQEHTFSEYTVLPAISVAKIDPSDTMINVSLMGAVFPLATAL
ncbi:hypothetical protein PR003_g2462 [Phytophthora rubi]|uniref:Uncharacterized protein n=1 Tax=Phytophthora rubi TaxID=129364 RepID=A0A6A4G1Z4_9STRA|nr:hypothetical protein PR003_g2462 [Phytophthora rubi]